jgi:hypothetical protein
VHECLYTLLTLVFFYIFSQLSVYGYSYILWKFAWKSCMFIGLQKGDILVCSPLVCGWHFICLSLSHEPQLVHSVIDGTRYEIIFAFDKLWKQVVILRLSWNRLLLRFTWRHQTDGYFYHDTLIVYRIKM